MPESHHRIVELGAVRYTIVLLHSILTADLLIQPRKVLWTFLTGQMFRLSCGPTHDTIPYSTAHQLHLRRLASLRQGIAVALLYRQHIF